jgi:hypothetical protein
MKFLVTSLFCVVFGVSTIAFAGKDKKKLRKPQESVQDIEIKKLNITTGVYSLIKNPKYLTPLRNALIVNQLCNTKKLETGNFVVLEKPYDNTYAIDASEYHKEESKSNRTTSQETISYTLRNAGFCLLTKLTYQVKMWHNVKKQTLQFEDSVLSFEQQSTSLGKGLLVAEKYNTKYYYPYRSNLLPLLCKKLFRDVERFAPYLKSEDID